MWRGRTACGRDDSPTSGLHGRRRFGKGRRGEGLSLAARGQTPNLSDTEDGFFHKGRTPWYHRGSRTEYYP